MSPLPPTHHQNSSPSSPPAVPSTSTVSPTASSPLLSQNSTSHVPGYGSSNLRESDDVSTGSDFTTKESSVTKKATEAKTHPGTIDTAAPADLVNLDPSDHDATLPSDRRGRRLSLAESLASDPTNGASRTSRERNSRNTQSEPRAGNAGAPPQSPTHRNRDPRKKRIGSGRDGSLHASLRTLDELPENLHHDSVVPPEAPMLDDQLGNTNYGLPISFGMEELEEERRRRAERASIASATHSEVHRRKQSRASTLGIDTLNTTVEDRNGDEASHEERESVESERYSDEYSDDAFDPSDPPDNSPYPQVRASVSARDDITLSVNTPRMWFLSMLFAILGSSTNLFFSLRYPSVSLTPVIALLLVHPLGLLWDAIFKYQDDPHEAFIDGNLAFRSQFPHPIPSSRVNDGYQTTHDDDAVSPTSTTARSTSALLDSAVSGKTRRSWRLWLGQGKWNEKEHACVYISSNVSFGFAFATDVIVEQVKFYKQDAPILYQILLTISTQVLGYAVAGITRRYLVRPSGMIWPSTLISTAMFSTLHNEENKPANGWIISRWRFFLAVFLGSLAWYFLPGLLMPALSFFNVITWFAPRNVVVANLFGTVSGLGLFPVTFDWSQIAYTGSPLVVPFWAALNVVGGLVLVMWIAAPLMYYANVLSSSYMPILSAAVFDNTGKPYDVSKILTPDFLFDEEAYQRYSRVFLPITYVLSYATQFAALTSLITHTICWHGSDIITQGKESLVSARNESKSTKYVPVNAQHTNGANRGPTANGNNMAWTQPRPEMTTMMSTEDVHNRLMQRYDDVPMWWYMVTGSVMLGIGMFVVEYYPVHLPWYGLLMAFGICIALFIPIGIVMAITSQQSSIYLVCQIICGVVFPGRPVANMVFVTYGYITSTQGMKFSSDMKLGHYMKIPPRLLFSVQLAATLVSSLTQIVVLNWALANIRGVCTPQAINGFTCPIARVHFNGSILWGVVGPWRFFGPDAMYRTLVWAFLVGAVCPVIVYCVARSRPQQRVWTKISFPVIFGSLSWIPPATGLNFSVWALVCYLFNHLLRTRREAWWRKYNMTLSAALDAGVAFGVVIVFFGFVYSGLSEGFSWWGTEVYKQGCDWQACPYKTVPPGERFGPGFW